MAKLNQPWTSEDVAKLMVLASAGATLLRASAALRRPSSSVTGKAKELGQSFPGVRGVRALLRKSGAIEALVGKKRR
jgi:hypothetical protein